MNHRAPLILVTLALIIAPNAIAAEGATNIKASILKTESGKLLQVSGSITIKASPQLVWAIMTDCPTVHNFVPGLKKCEVLKADPKGQWDIRRHTGKGSFPFKGAISEFKSEYTYPNTITFNRTGGDYDTLDGQWILQPDDNGSTNLKYSSRLSASAPVPKGMIKDFAKKRMRKTLEAVKKAVETPEK